MEKKGKNRHYLRQEKKKKKLKSRARPFVSAKKILSRKKEPKVKVEGGVVPTGVCEYKGTASPPSLSSIPAL